MATKRRTTKKKVTKKVGTTRKRGRKKVAVKPGLGLHEIALLQDVEDKVSKINHAVTPHAKGK